MAYILYDGPSMLDGKPIVAILTGIKRPSSNVKTGPMAQVWILRKDINPIEAVKTGEDFSVCGSCPLRGINGKQRLCYVTIHQAPNQVFKQIPKAKPYKKGLLRNRPVRLGAYGDMAAVPTEVTEMIAKEALFTTGYTHQWQSCDQELQKYLMASCESPYSREQAKAAGWATFRVKSPEKGRLHGETLCPASDEAGKKLQCFTCAKCSGNQAKDVVINVHGTGKRHFPLIQEAA